MLKPWKVIVNIKPHFKVILSRWNAVRSLFMHSSFRIMFPTVLYKKAKVISQNALKVGFFAFTKAKNKLYSNSIIGIDLISNLKAKAILNFKNTLELGFKADLLKKAKMKIISAFKMGFIGTYHRKRNKKINNTIGVDFISSRYKKGRLIFDNGIFRNQTILSLKNTEIEELKFKTIRWIKNIYIIFPQFRVDLFINLLKKIVTSFYNKIEIGFFAQLLNKIGAILDSKFAFTLKVLLKYKGKFLLKNGIEVDSFIFTQKKGKLYFGGKQFVNPIILWFKKADAVMPQFGLEFESYIKKKSEVNHTIGYLKTLNIGNIKQKTIGIIKTQY